MLIKDASGVCRWFVIAGLALTVSLAACGDDDHPLGDDGGPGDDAGTIDAGPGDDAADIDAPDDIDGGTGLEICGNGADDDGDDATDCEDSDCAASPSCNPETDCDDGDDNDGDGDADCLDADCDQVGSCELGIEATCNDAIDNDGDSARDCADGDCAADPGCVPEANCHDTLDDDGDGEIDCADADCALAANCVPEANCSDTLDDDGDGEIDCADSDCALAASCVPEGNCSDTLDDDGDGAIDCADSDCAGACAADCPAGSTLIVASATDLPKAFGPAATTTDIVVAVTGVITAVAVGVDLDHAYDGDVGLAVQSPAGVVTVLSDAHGSAGDNYTDTMFSDGAATAIAAGIAPFTGEFRPDEVLAAHATSPSAGVWTFGAFDNYPSADDGTLNRVDLYLCVCSGPDCEIGLACRDGVDDDGDGDADCADTGCAAEPSCLPETVCDDGLDDDFDDDIDCADTDCDGIGTCEHGVELTCDDGVDNDADGGDDCADTDCAAVPLCSSEVDCGNGLDDDSDGVTDCADPGCVGVGACQASETSCDDAFDNDGDGATDCADSTCAGQLICAIAVCPAGTSKAVYTATNVPVAIPDLATGTSTIAIADLGLVVDVAVQVNIAHAFDADVDLSFTAPGGTNDLSSDNGGSGDNFANTIFVDSAATAVTAGVAPFAGRFRPEQAFAPLYGSSLAGNWVLTGTDDEGGIAGTINAFAVLVCACDAASGACELGAACRDGTDNDGNGDIDCEEAACAIDVSCIPEPICDDGLDDDLDGDTDCADEDCDGIAGCELDVETTCDDGFDNDADGNEDCLDSDCVAAAACLTESSCTNGIDDDSDGFTDCADDECATTAICTVETSCNDGIDNDGDGQIDCAEPLCNGIDGCTFGGEFLCNDGIDNDSDGLLDAAEPQCGWVVTALAACPAGLLQGYRAADLPQTIPAAGATTRNSFIAVAAVGTVADVAVRINIAHTFDSDLDILLLSPTGTSRELSTDNGLSGDNFNNTVFTDSAAGVIGTAGFNNPPFTGAYRPEQAFAPTLVGQTIAGNWNLRVTDQFDTDGGTFNEFSVGLCLQ